MVYLLWGADFGGTRLKVYLRIRLPFRLRIKPLIRLGIIP